MREPRVVLLLSVLLGASLLVTTAFAQSKRGPKTWKRSDTFSVKIADGYKFHKVVSFNSRANPCKVTSEFHFTAPNARWIRFQARVKFNTKAWMRSDRFQNTTSGNRKYTYVTDSTKDGCWGARPQKPKYLWVTFCRTTGCTPALPGPGQKSDKTKTKPKPSKTSKPACSGYKTCIGKCSSNYCMTRCDEKYAHCQ